MCFQELRANGHQDSLRVYTTATLVRGLEPGSHQKQLHKWRYFLRKTTPGKHNHLFLAFEGLSRHLFISEGTHFAQKYNVCILLLLARSLTFKDRSPSITLSRKKLKFGNRYNYLI